MFYQGQKVVCIDAVFNERTRLCAAYHNLTLPLENGVYSVRKSFGDAIHLVEIVNPTAPLTTGGFAEVQFCNERFAPLDDMEQAIEAVKELLLEVECFAN